MGCLSSKMVHGNGARQVRVLSDVQKYLESTEETCNSDSEMRVFHETLTASTARTVIELAAGTQESSHPLSLNSIKVVVDLLLEGNSEVAKVILREKTDIWKDPDLKSLVEEYLEKSGKTLDMCTSFERSLHRAKQCRFLIKETVRQFEEASPEERVVKTENNLRKLKEVGDPFTEEFFQIFQSVYEQQLSVLEKLTKRREALEKKLKSTKTWRNVSTVLFIATFVSLLFLSVVAAAVSAPPVFTALASALTVPVGSIGKWCSSLWGKYINQVENELELVKTMKRTTAVKVIELESIKNQVERLELTLETIGRVADTHLSEEEAMRIAVDEMAKKIDLVTNIVEDLVSRARLCRQHVKHSTSAVLDRVWKYSETSSINII